MEPLPQLTPGMIFARDFRVVRLLSAGGMGAVYVVEQISTQRPRALKIMLPDLVRDPTSRARFTQEATVAGRIKSDHIVEVVSAGIDEATNTPWIAMELLEGEELAQAMTRRGALPPAEVMEVMRQLCHGLGAAHRAGLVHRDLKPENVFLCTARREGVPFMVKVLDFGIAKVVGESRTSAQSTSSIGSPMWMAPEQAEQGQIRPATDVWALGLIAFHLLTGRFYWRSVNLADVALAALMKEIFVDPIEPASQRAAQLGVGQLIPPGFDGWFHRAVSRDATHRFVDAAEALAHLLPVLGGAAGVTPNAVTYPGLPPSVAPPAAPMIQPTQMHTPAGFPTPPPAPGGFVGGTQAWSPQGPPSHPGGWPQPYAPPPSGSSGKGPLLAVAGLAVLAIAGAGVAALSLSGSGDDPPGADGGASPSLLPMLRRPSPPAFRGPQCRGTGMDTDIPGLTGVVSVSAGRFHSCAVTRDGITHCWGWNANKQLGDGSTEDQYSPMAVPGLTGVVRVAAGQSFTCALQSTGNVACWGLGARGEMPRPTLVEGVSLATQISLGELHGCARRSDGTVMCWGHNSSGELGDGSRESRAGAVPVRGLTGVTQVSVGGFHSCALRGDGTVWCWGQQEHGELGNGRRGREPVSTPTQALGVAGAIQVAAGEYHTCALIRGGSVMCWGSNDQGALGGPRQGNIVTPQLVQGLQGVARIAAGYTHNCAMHSDRTVTCWGSNNTCQLGRGGLLAGRDPIDLEALGAVSDISPGGMHTCAIRPNGAVRCWGYNNYGQTGSGSNSTQPDISY
ncbi:MAG: protein kinase [Polyangiales bacterium]